VRGAYIFHTRERVNGNGKLRNRGEKRGIERELVFQEGRETDDTPSKGAKSRTKSLR